VRTNLDIYTASLGRTALTYHPGRVFPETTLRLGTVEQPADDTETQAPPWRYCTQEAQRLGSELRLAKDGGIGERTAERGEGGAEGATAWLRRA
jgi:hypothetical protein